ncbi:MAG: EscU/YscU/HrcU family type III secretion system export apparatus switch protein [Actinomycetota bacterium]
MAKDSAQRSEKPTPKRLREGRQRGQIPRSPDLVGWLSLLIASFVLPAMARSMHSRMAGYLEKSAELAATGDSSGAMGLSVGLAATILWVLLAFMLVLFVASAIGMAVQGGVTLTTKPLRPKLERISPKAGIKRLVSAQSLVDTGKAVFRLVVMALLVFQVGLGTIEGLLQGQSLALEPAGAQLGSAVLLVLRLVALLGIAVGLADYAFQRRKIGKQLKMTKHEVKQENKNTEGDPTIKSRRRSLHANVSRNQMLAAVEDASVVVVNPTHVAVALSYNAGQVPTVVAKGGDELARRIRERAFSAGVPVVEARPLARVLHDLLDIGSEVPAHLYEAVAIVIAFVMRTPDTVFDAAIRRVNIPASKMLDANPLAAPADADGDDRPALPSPTDPGT